MMGIPTRTFSDHSGETNFSDASFAIKLKECSCDEDAIMDIVKRKKPPLAPSPRASPSPSKSKKGSNSKTRPSLSRSASSSSLVLAGQSINDMEDVFGASLMDLDMFDLEGDSSHHLQKNKNNDRKNESRDESQSKSPSSSSEKQFQLQQRSKSPSSSKRNKDNKPKRRRRSSTKDDAPKDKDDKKHRRRSSTRKSNSDMESANDSKISLLAEATEAITAIAEASGYYLLDDHEKKKEEAASSSARRGKRRSKSVDIKREKRSKDKNREGRRKRRSKSLDDRKARSTVRTSSPSPTLKDDTKEIRKGKRRSRSLEERKPTTSSIPDKAREIRKRSKSADEKKRAALARKSSSDFSTKKEKSSHHDHKKENQPRRGKSLDARSRRRTSSSSSSKSKSKSTSVVDKLRSPKSPSSHQRSSLASPRNSSPSRRQRSPSSSRHRSSPSRRQRSPSSPARRRGSLKPAILVDGGTRSKGESKSLSPNIKSSSERGMRRSKRLSSSTREIVNTLKLLVEEKSSCKLDAMVDMDNILAPTTALVETTTAIQKRSKSPSLKKTKLPSSSHTNSNKPSSELFESASLATNDRKNIKELMDLIQKETNPTEYEKQDILLEMIRKETDAKQQQSLQNSAASFDQVSLLPRPHLDDRRNNSRSIREKLLQDTLHNNITVVNNNNQDDRQRRPPLGERKKSNNSSWDSLQHYLDETCVDSSSHRNYRNASTGAVRSVVSDPTVPSTSSNKTSKRARPMMKKRSSSRSSSSSSPQVTKPSSWWTLDTHLKTNTHKGITDSGHRSGITDSGHEYRSVSSAPSKPSSGTFQKGIQG